MTAPSPSLSSRSRISIGRVESRARPVHITERTPFLDGRSSQSSISSNMRRAYWVLAEAQEVVDAGISEYASRGCERSVNVPDSTSSTAG